MTKFGMPGVFAHGDFDTWSPGYLMFLAALHNGISRLYETFGNGNADTRERTLEPEEYARTWYRQNPPLPKALWSQRDNNNYEETGLLTSLHYFNENKRLFLKNFYLKAKRSVMKPSEEGPAAYVLPADDPRAGLQVELLRVLEKQGVEISRAKAAFHVALPAKKEPKPKEGAKEAAKEGEAAKATPAPTTREFPAGSYIVRVDQPFSRIADALLDYQYWAPDDPQRQPYDDTGWTFPELFNVKAIRVADLKVLDATVERVKGDVAASGGVTGTGSVFLINHNADPSLITLRYRFKDANFDVAEEPFDANGEHFNRGSFVVRDVSAGDLGKAAADLGLKVTAVASAPSMKTHPGRAPRVAIMHTWLSTQDEGWWRETLDFRDVPYTYISTQDAATE